MFVYSVGYIDENMFCIDSVCKQCSPYTPFSFSFPFISPLFTVGSSHVSSFTLNQYDTRVLLDAQQ